MNGQEFKRKLTAIMSLDVVGYSRLMGEAEEATVRTITGHRSVITAVIQKYRGRVVDSPGDNMLAEFVSVVDAVQSAVETQEVIRGKNAELPENCRMKFRIGINLGDVIQEGERIYGGGRCRGPGLCVSLPFLCWLSAAWSHTLAPQFDALHNDRLRHGTRLHWQPAFPQRNTSSWHFAVQWVPSARSVGPVLHLRTITRKLSFNLSGLVYDRSTWCRVNDFQPILSQMSSSICLI
jgi:hypothetical protein